MYSIIAISNILRIIVFFFSFLPGMLGIPGKAYRDTGDHHLLSDSEHQSGCLFDGWISVSVNKYLV